MYGATRKRVTSELSTKDRPKKKELYIFHRNDSFVGFVDKYGRAVFFLFWFCVLSSVRIYKPNEIACKYVFFFFFLNFALFISILSFIQTPLVVNVRPGFPQLHSKNIVVVSTLRLIVADCFPWKKKT